MEKKCFKQKNIFGKTIKFNHQITNNDTQGTYELYISWEDKLGNAETKKIDDDLVHIDEADDAVLWREIKKVSYCFENRADITIK